MWETRAAGADAGLLIAAALSADALTALLHEFFAASLDVLVEVHTEEELLAALNALGEMADSSTGPAQAVLGINYVIWQDKIWTAGSPKAWGPYYSTVYGCPDDTNITGCHMDHIHVSFY